MEFLESRSPYYATKQVKAPLLIVHGRNDYLYPESAMNEYVGKLVAHGVPVEYHIYEDEMHGLAKPENRLDFFRRAELFLAGLYGTRYEK